MPLSSYFRQTQILIRYLTVKSHPKTYAADSDVPAAARMACGGCRGVDCSNCELPNEQV